MITTYDVEELLNETFPVPKDLFEQAVRIQQLEAVFEFLSEDYKNRRMQIISRIRTEQLTSSLYRVLPKIERHVNGKLLKSKFPEIYDRLVYIKAPDARKVLGDRTMYEVCLETDAFRTEGFSRVRTPDLIANLGETASEEFFIHSEVLGAMRIVPWDV